jgi:putative ABC transport system permease protein
VAGVAQAEMWSRYNANLLLNDGRQGREKEAGLGAELIGIPNGSTIFRPILVAGRWLLPQEGYAILISQAMADLNEIGVGDSVTLDLGVYGEQDWVVVGIFQDIYGFQIGTTDPIYANQQAVFAATKQYNRGRDLYVQSENRTETATETMVNRVKTLFEARQVDVNTSETLYDLRRGTENQFNILITMLLSLAIIVAAVGGIGLMGSLSISVVERTREIGVMRSIGAQDGVIIRTFVLEGILQGLLSWVLVLPLAFALSRPLADALGMVVIGTTFDFRFSGLGVLLWLILIVVISGGAAIIPARHAANISVRESLAYV